MIEITIKGKEINLSSFENRINKDTLSVKIDNNGRIIFNKNSNSQGTVSPGNIKNNKNNSDKLTDNDSKDGLLDSEKGNLQNKNKDNQEIHNSNSTSNTNGKNINNTDNNANSKSNDHSDTKQSEKNINIHTDEDFKDENDVHSKKEAEDIKALVRWKIFKNKDKKDKKDKNNSGQKYLKPSWRVTRV